MVVGAMLLLAGCDGVKVKGRGEGAGRPGDGQTAAAGEAWPFVPVAMRIHPFTSFEMQPDKGTGLLDARIELLDRVGDMTKGVGRFRFELYQTSGRASGNPAQDTLLFAWQVPLVTVEQNVQHYDAITRTYSFHLKMNKPIPPRAALRLVVQFDNAFGRRLNAFRDLPPVGGGSSPPDESAGRAGP